MKTFSVLEQFEILPLVNAYGYHFIDFSITNQTVMLFIIFIVLFLFYEAIVYKNSIRFVPPYLQVIFEMFFKMITSVIVSNIGRKNGQRFFSFNCYRIYICINL
jgi:F0F1-type ATP synthase membrane subunit a